MKLSHFFIDRPRFATVLSGLIVIFGVLSFFSLPISQYPEIAPPQVQVMTAYPGANSETIAETVATPLEQSINGVENMLYMSSQSTNDGTLTITITFKPGTDIDTAQVLVQNRVSTALPRLPEAVRRQGVQTIKNSPDFLLAINLYSPDDVYDQIFIGNYAVLNVQDRLKRLEGIGNSQMFGASQYAMRVWLNPEKLASLNLTAGDVMQALRAQNVQVAGGILNRSPMPQQNAFEFTVETQGRLLEKEEFEKVVIKTGERGQLVHLGDVARVDLGAENYITKGYLGTKPSVVVITTLSSGANALEAAERVKTTMKDIAKDFPPGMEYKIVYNPTEYIAKSIQEVITTLLIAVALVVLVVIVFLQSWRTAIIPVIAIPISLIGTFGLMMIFGYSLNMLSLFGLVLAIGIVVDDAIVVVENVERKLREGLDIKIATKTTMDEVGTALIATSLVLVAVFLPTVLMEGISGQFYKQFGVTIAAATLISTVVSLTLSPAMAAIFMKDLGNVSEEDRPWPARVFNRGMDRLSHGYGYLVSKIVRLGVVISLVYAALIGLGVYGFTSIPTGFIPPQDQGYVMTILQLPPGSSLSRTDEVVEKAVTEILKIEGVDDTVAFSGFSAATFSNASNAAAIFTVLKPMEERPPVAAILGQMQQALFMMDEAFIVTVPPPPVPGMGNAGGFRMMVQDKAGHGPPELEKAVWALAMAANQAPETTNVFTFFETSTPRVYLDIDREKALQLNVPIEQIFDALQIYLGSGYVNDFNFLGRTFRVTAQAEGEYRKSTEDILKLKVRNRDGQMVPISAIANVKNTTGPSLIPRYNLYPAAAISGNTMLGYSSGQALDKMEELANNVLPKGFDFEWTEIALQEKQVGNSALIIFSLAVLFVFLLLAAQYESWTLPLAIILIVPMCLLSASIGLIIMGMDNNILTQIGLVVLVGLASKNAILIVEFAKQNQELLSMSRWEAAISAAKVRLRPILMTAFSFILGVIPLLVATGAGFEMRRAIGLTVFSGMLGVTLFGLLFTPVFYVICQRLAGDSQKAPNVGAHLSTNN